MMNNGAVTKRIELKGKVDFRFVEDDATLLWLIRV